MQYYVKIFNTNTNELVGYYKETGRNCISTMMNGMKYFNSLEKAIEVCKELDDGFIRDKDKHYYTAFACVYGDVSKQPTNDSKQKSNLEKKEELEDELKTLIRKNSSKAKYEAGD